MTEVLEQQRLRDDNSNNSEDTIALRFERQVAAVPDKLALVTDEVSLTYRALDLKASGIAAVLASLPSPRDRPLALFMKEEAARIAAMLGTWKANRIFIPVAPGSPQKRLTEIIEHSGTAHIIVDSSTRSIAERAATGSITVVEVEQLPRSLRPFVADRTASPDDTAYIVYTSGSTGRPKGVAITHRSEIWRADVRYPLFGLGRNDRYANLRLSGGAPGVNVTLLSLLCGGTLFPFDLHRHGLQTLAPWLVAQKITYVNSTASLLRTWLASLPDDLRFPELRFVGATDERLYAQDVLRVSRHLEGYWRVGHRYSSTEAGTITAQVFTSSHLPDSSIVAVSVGRPVNGVEVCVKDETDALAASGEIGEIVLRSRFLAQGYWNNPELTAKAFQTDPFDSAIRIYRTGDFGRWRSDGTLELVGRKGRRIRLLGYSIEPFEVECELMNQLGVTDAVVLLHDGAAGHEPCLVGYVVAPANASPSAIRQGLAERLPSYMVPSHIVVLDSFPIAASGKIDRKALPAPEERSPELNGLYVAPRTPTEDVLASIWREVLNVKQVGVHDNFFEVGGHSLLAMQVVVRLSKVLKVDLPLKRFFKTPTISALAADLQTMVGATETKLQSTVSVLRTGSLPLSFAQQRLWFLDQLLPNRATYNIPTVWRLQGPLDVPALERSLNALVARHETLRTRFTLSEDEPVQLIEPPGALVLPITDLGALPPFEREARAREIIDSDLCQPFDLESGPLLRVRLLRLAQEEHLLLFNVHHIISDDWSMGILWRELSHLYSAFVSRQAPDLPLLPIQYADYALWQRDWLKGEVLERQLAYWKDKLADLSPLELPTDHPRPPMPGHRGARLTFDLPEPLTQALKELSRRQGATLFMTLLAAFQVLLHRYSGQDDIPVGTPIAGRGHTEVEGLVGFFVNTLVLRSNLAGNPTFAELLAQVRETALGAYAHQDLPFEKVVEELSPSRDISRNPLFQVIFALQNAPGAELTLKRTQASRVQPTAYRAKFDLTVTMRETTAGLNIRWEYSTDLFDASTVERMAQHFKMLLEGIVADPNKSIGQLLLLTNAGHHQLPIEWNQAALERKESLEDSYPLSSLQQGMLFHAVWEKGSGVDIAQFLFDLHETLDVEKFKRAWSRVITRHPILRTSFRWKTLDQPQQQVHAKVELYWEEQDWRAFTDLEREKRLTEFLAEDRRRGFDMARAPLFRLTLLRYGEAYNRLIWTYHHILLDGRSRRLVQREVSTYYQAFLRNEDLTWATPPPFRDYINWLQQQDFGEHESFWRQRLKGFSAPTPLRVDHVPKATVSDATRSGIHEVRLSTEITSALRSIAKENGLTLATITQGAWAILLSRYSGEADVVFGIVCSNRRGTIEAADEVIGLCINTLPMRMHVNSEMKVVSWLKVIREQWKTMRDHVHTPLVKIQGWSEVSAGQPLFSSVMSFQDYQSDVNLQTQGSVWSNRRVRMIEQPNYPVSLLADDGTELQLTIFFDRSRIDDDATQRMLGHLGALLEGIAVNPQQEVGKLPLLTSSERQKLLLEWNQTEVNYPRAKSVHQLFEEQVERTPNAVALIFKDRRLSYAKLNAQSNQLARYLQRYGVRRGCFVACCMERSADLIITLLAALKAGGAYVALDTGDPSRRLHSILENARPVVLVVKSHDEKAAIDSMRLAEGGRIESLPTVVCLDDHAQSISNESEENPHSKTTSEDQAYVCFTSGSSGKPKGVIIPHRAIVRLVKNTNYVSLSPSDVFLQLAPISFDASTFEIWGCLLNGSQLVVPPPGMLSFAQIGSLIQKHNISVLWLTAGLFHQMIDHELESLAGVRQLLAGGDVLSVAHVRKAVTHLGEARVINGYGPTENTTFTCCYPTTELSAEEQTVPIGRPISNTQCFILDRDLQPVPIGVRGELFASGDGLARGYLNDPKLTAEKFIPNPFRPGALLYRTGDYGRYRPDGNIEFLGRSDNQVKLNGYRIELGEIESALKLHPIIRDAIVAAREDVPDDRRLVAYVSPASAASRASELREFLKERLPAYMLPSAFVFLDEFPLTPNGKVDRRALAELKPVPHAGSGSSLSTNPRSTEAMHDRLSIIWKSLLGVEFVGRDDDFFELGGHSLLGSRLLVQIEKEFGVRLPLTAIFQAPTVNKLADQIRRSRSPIDGDRKRPLFCAAYGLGFALARHLGWDQPVYELHESVAEHSRIETLAASCVDEIRKIQPAGPYFLSGYSASGIVAYEMAQQLISHGEEVGLLAIVESQPFKLHRKRYSVRRLMRFTRRLRSRRPSLWLDFTLGKVISVSRRTIDRVQGKPLPAWALISQLHAHYKAKPYSGRITLFLSAEEIEFSELLRKGWARLAAGELEVIMVPGDHHTMVQEPHVRVLAARIKERLPSSSLMAASMPLRAQNRMSG